MEEVKNYITPQKAADKLDVCRKTVYRMMNDGRLTKYKLSKKCVRIDAEELEALKEARSIKEQNTA